MSLLEEHEEQEYVMRPQPSKDTYHEASHALCAAFYRRTVGPVTVSKYAMSMCWWGEPDEDTDPADAIREDIVATLAGRIGEAFYSRETDAKLSEVFGLPTHNEERHADKEPTEDELELIEWQSQDEQQFGDQPNDDLRVLELLDRLELLEPDLDRARELRDCEGRAAEILNSHQTHLQLIAEALRDYRILPVGGVNAIFDIPNEPGEED